MSKPELDKLVEMSEDEKTELYALAAKRVLGFFVFKLFVFYLIRKMAKITRPTF